MVNKCKERAISGKEKRRNRIVGEELPATGIWDTVGIGEGLMVGASVVTGAWVGREVGVRVGVETTGVAEEDEEKAKGESESAAKTTN